MQRTLFNDPAEELKPAQRVEFYKHDMGWTNRLILGDSLVVMNSLLEVKGRDRAPEVDKRQAAKRWVEAMNYLHTQTKGAENDLGRWAYLFVKDEQRYYVRNHINAMAEGQHWSQGSTGYGWEQR